MNISRLSSVPANLQPASARPYPTSNGDSDKRTDNRPHATHHSQGTAGARAQGLDDGDGDVDGAEGQNFGTRVANFASQIENRLQNAIAGGNLSDDQLAQLKDAAAQFHDLMNRIGNADFAKTPRRQVMFALHQFTQQIQSVLHPQQTEDPGQVANLVTRGADKVAAQTLPTIDTVA